MMDAPVIIAIAITYAIVFWLGRSTRQKTAPATPVDLVRVDDAWGGVIAVGARGAALALRINRVEIGDGRIDLYYAGTARAHIEVRSLVTTPGSSLSSNHVVRPVGLMSGDSLEVHVGLRVTEILWDEFT